MASSLVPSQPWDQYAPMTKVCNPSSLSRRLSISVTSWEHLSPCWTRHPCQRGRRRGAPSSQTRGSRAEGGRRGERSEEMRTNQRGGGECESHPPTLQPAPMAPHPYPIHTFFSLSWTACKASSTWLTCEKRWRVSVDTEGYRQVTAYRNTG